MRTPDHFGNEANTRDITGNMDIIAGNTPNIASFDLGNETNTGTFRVNTIDSPVWTPH